MLLVCRKESEPPGRRSQPEAGNEVEVIGIAVDSQCADTWSEGTPVLRGLGVGTAFAGPKV
jgi:hypothetical protein